MDSLTTVMQTPNCSSLFPHPPPTTTAQCASRNVWQTSLLGQLRITSNSTSVKLNSFIPEKDCPRMDLSVTVEDVIISSLSAARKLGLTLDNRLHVPPISLQILCRFAFYNIRRIQSFFTKDGTQPLVQVLIISHLDYCNFLLTGHPTSTTKPLQGIQNAAARLFHDLHWLPVAACIRFKMMVLAFKAINRTAPSNLQTLVRPQALTRALHSSTSAVRLVLPSQRANKACSAKSLLFSVLARQWWNELPTNVRTAESLSIFCKRLICSDFTPEGLTVVSIFLYIMDE